MNIQMLHIDSLTPATYNPRKKLKPGDPEFTGEPYRWFRTLKAWALRLFPSGRGTKTCLRRMMDNIFIKTDSAGVL